MTEITFREALGQALTDELEADGDVFLIGEDIAEAGGPFKVTTGLLERFGPDRVLNTPISEQAIIGCAIGAAVQGLRPIAEIMFADFAGVCHDQIVNEMAKYRYMTDGQVTLPVTVRLNNGAGLGFGAQHSQSVENWFLNIPGLKIAVPATPADAYGLMRSAVRDDNPVLIFEHKALLNRKEVCEELVPVPLGEARIARSGEDVTVVATQAMVHKALEAADVLAEEGISVEVVDPRTLVPLDIATIAGSVDRTHHLVVVQESPYGGCWGSTVVAALAVSSLESFDAPPVIVATDWTPVPFAHALEEAWIPTTERVVDAVRRCLA